MAGKQNDPTDHVVIIILSKINQNMIDMIFKFHVRLHVPFKSL